MFQFRIVTLLILTVLVAVGAWILFVLPDDVALVVLVALNCIVPALVIPGIVYHRGYWRAFFIGAAPIVCAAFLYVVLSFQNILQVVYAPNYYPQYGGLRGVEMQKVVLMASHVLGIASGLIAMIVRFWASKLDERERPAA